MKTWTTAVGVGALALATSVSGVVVKFNENLMAAGPARSSRFSFATEDAGPLPHNLLMTMDGYYGPTEGFECAVDATRNASTEVTVLIAISKCLNESAIANIEKWVGEIKAKELTYFENDVAQKLTFATTLIPGDCQERTEREKKGLPEPVREDVKYEEGAAAPAAFLLSNDVQPEEIARISAFAKFGRVLDAAPTKQEEIPIAVVSFVNNAYSYHEVEQYEKKSHITSSFNFQICDKGKSCEGRFENCVFLEEDVDLFMYNPFTITRSFECDGVLTDGVPVSYVDSYNVRQCFCACPAGYEVVTGNYGKKACEPIVEEPCPCTWDTHPFGYKIENDKNLETCKFCEIASTYGVPVPFPVDNYVADGRRNRFDESTREGPHVDLSMSQQFSNVYNEINLEHIFEKLAAGTYTSSPFPPTWAEFLEFLRSLDIDLGEMDQSLLRPFYTPAYPYGPTEHQRYTWRTFQNKRVEKIDQLEFTSYGKYQLVVDAVDYSDSAKCTGCVSIVDKFRPRATTKCPTHFCDNTTSVCDGADEATAELTDSNLKRADEIVEGVYRFRNKATNDKCSEEECDYKLHRVKDFFEDEYCKEREWRSGRKCFNKKEVQDAFIQSREAKKNPLVKYDATGQPCGMKDEDEPVAPGQCTRCCSVETKLREFWTDYTCGCDYDIRRCSGLEEESCGLRQCLTMFGDTLAHVSACIKPAVVEESEKVLSGLVQEGWQTVTQVHRSISCTDLNAADPACSFRSRVTDLVDVSAEVKVLSATLNPDEYVFWRYRVKGDGEGWRSFTPDDASSMATLVFAQATTKITLEAWTACGLVRRFFFFVHLHVHSDIAVCDYFSEMWYQTSTNRLPIASDICAYPGSDFAEVTFDFRPFAGLKYDRNKLRPDVTGVKCVATVAGRSGVQILTSDATNPEIIQRYAVELLNTGRTNHTTTVKMECDFTYTHHDKTTKTKTCHRSITMADCTGPKFDDKNGECLQECANRNLPGPYEACGGQIISHTAQKTTFSKGDEKCCQRCSVAKTKCTAILGLVKPEQDIKRCVPEVTDYEDYTYKGGAYENENEYVEAYTDAEDTPPNYQGAALLASVKRLAEQNVASSALAGMSALVAVVALVAVNRRRATPVPTAEDAYYPLLN